MQMERREKGREREREKGLGNQKFGTPVKYLKEDDGKKDIASHE